MSPPMAEWSGRGGLVVLTSDGRSPWSLDEVRDDETVNLFQTAQAQAVIVPSQNPDVATHEPLVNVADLGRRSCG
jgi:hypothetical protein